MSVPCRMKAQQGFIGAAGRCAEELFSQIYNHSYKTIPLQLPERPTYESLPLASSNEIKGAPTCSSRANRQLVKGNPPSSSREIDL
ncbi:unnamed protein product [Protopolystoma xenopodis]|uniref:Uncharacterized protein n=1 Tax=Protopolystoma xenopodis TaxID=117903 RepID=A0A3S5AW95_9PLAT|nr:unnamed protein product [Protopolystoma xenopodis]